MKILLKALEGIKVIQTSACLYRFQIDLLCIQIFV